VSPELAEGPSTAPALKLAAPVIERVDAVLTVSVALLLRVSDEKTYVPPVSTSVAPALTRTVP
jgi:hypothetical protein